MTLTRKEFLKTTLALAAAGLVGPACGDDTDGTTTGTTNGTTTGTPTTSSTGAMTTSSSGGGNGGNGGEGGGQGGNGGEGGGQGGNGGQGGDGGQGGSMMANCIDNGTNSNIAANHGHAVTVTATDIEAGVDKTYDIQGASMHTHSITITAAQFATLAGNTSIMVTSTLGGMGHTHVVTVTCA